MESPRSVDAAFTLYRQTGSPEALARVGLATTLMAERDWASAAAGSASCAKETALKQSSAEAMSVMSDLVTLLSQQ